MPQYFFHLVNGETLEDTDGECFDNPVHARDHAASVAQELAGGSATGKSICVRDKQGTVVFKTEIPG